MFKPEYYYTDEIKDMMYVFGDNKHPLDVSVKLIEDLVHKMISSMVLQFILDPSMRLTSGLKF